MGWQGRECCIAALFSSLLPQRYPNPCMLCPRLLRMGSCLLGASALALSPWAWSSPQEGDAAISREFLSLPCPWLGWKGVGFTRLILRGLVYRVKRKEIAGPEVAMGWGSATCANHHQLSPGSLCCGEARMEETARSPEVGVRSLPPGSLSQRRPCQSLWCRAR